MNVKKTKSSKKIVLKITMSMTPIIKEEHLDIGGESGHVIACHVQDKMVCSILG